MDVEEREIKKYIINKSVDQGKSGFMCMRLAGHQPNKT